MAATDVTYLFFQRDTGAGKVDNGPMSPVIKTTHVAQLPAGAGVRRLRKRNDV